MKLGVPKWIVSDPMTYTFLRYLAAVILPLTSLVIELFINRFAGTNLTVSLFFIAVSLSAWNGGSKPGIVSTVLSSIFLVIFFFSRQTQFASLIQTLFFLIGSVFLVLMVSSDRWQNKLDQERKKERDLALSLEKLSEEYKDALKEIRSRDEFLSIASHELKTPLTSMLLQTQAVLHNIRNVSLAHFSIDNLLKMLESVENQTKRLSRMINDLLNVSLITTGNMQLELEKIDLDIIVNDVLVEFRERLRQKGYVLFYDNRESVIGMWDRVRLEQAISNLISNAIKYGANNPIEVETRRKNNHAEILVRDQGIGIHKDQQKKIFDLFERATPNTDIKGLGVGLYITQQIVSAHNGNISVKSRLGNGTTFTIYLPITKT